MAKTRTKNNDTAANLGFEANTRVMHNIVSGYANVTTVNMLPIEALQRPLALLPLGRVVAMFSDIAEAARKRREEMVEKGATLAHLRNTLLPKLISGELRVKDVGRFVAKAV